MHYIIYEQILQYKRSKDQNVEILCALVEVSILEFERQDPLETFGFRVVVQRFLSPFLKVNLMVQLINSES